jgi:hypothetical protein
MILSSIFVGGSEPLKMRKMSALRKFFFSPKLELYSISVILKGFIEIGFSLE